ncbi:signal peptide peptidase SppA [Desulfonema ishimotonii]|uniref:Signal peptide peptidase SppA n=1 Tax=Desulfonema ishimotonii TaxID=45657 RepID=A0A401G350_9BACT|nr:signal peptide peptidase SppA [Desulfonema ishimotonii]GBC63669.1 signal peptide peptidase SppA [Desulfonema ishimotonii]
MRNPVSIGAAVLILILALTGCAPEIRLFPDARDPLREFTLEGTGREKVLVIPVRGNITDAPRREFMRTRPGMVRQIVSHLRKAEGDKRVRAILLKIDSPGGTATASDLIYHELMVFRQRTGVPIVAALMNVATSGGYYIALPADRIFAHPTTVTGSVGVIFVRPVVTGLMEKIGIEADVHKTGPNKDMGSPFRPLTPGEDAMIQTLINTLGARFLGLVKARRNLGEAAMSEIGTARICLADTAKSLGLIDEIGYLSDALASAKSLAGLDRNARVVVYRRTEYPEDNIYNTAATTGPGPLVDVGLPAALAGLKAGFWYLWQPGAMAD